MSTTDSAKPSQEFPDIVGYADLLPLIPFLALCVLLYLVGRDVVLVTRPKT